MPVMPLCQDRELIVILCYIIKVRTSLSYVRK